MQSNGPVILFDGVCAVCNRFVQLVLERDEAGLFRFAPLQSEYGRGAAERGGHDPDEISSVLLVLEPGTAREQVLDRSAAVLWIAERLGGVYSLLVPFKVLPRAVLDPLYTAFANLRYRVMGKQEVCMVPKPEWRARFIESPIPG